MGSRVKRRLSPVRAFRPQSRISLCSFSPHRDRPLALLDPQRSTCFSSALISRPIPSPAEFVQSALSLLLVCRASARNQVQPAEAAKVVKASLAAMRGAALAWQRDGGPPTLPPTLAPLYEVRAAGLLVV